MKLTYWKDDPHGSVCAVRQQCPGGGLDIFTRRKIVVYTKKYKRLSRTSVSKIRFEEVRSLASRLRCVKTNHTVRRKNIQSSAMTGIQNT